MNILMTIKYNKIQYNGKLNILILIHLHLYIHNSASHGINDYEHGSVKLNDKFGLVFCYSPHIDLLQSDINKFIVDNGDMNSNPNPNPNLEISTIKNERLDPNPNSPNPAKYNNTINKHIQLLRFFNAINTLSESDCVVLKKVLEPMHAHDRLVFFNACKTMRRRDITAPISDTIQRILFEEN